MSTPTLPQLRISQAALGRRLASVLLLSREGKISEEEFLATITAVYDSCVEEDYTPDPEAEINTEVYEQQRTEIEKSARRSEAARKAARRRRQQREKKEETVMMPPKVKVSPIEKRETEPATPRPSRKKDRGLKRRLRKIGDASRLLSLQPREKE